MHKIRFLLKEKVNKEKKQKKYIKEKGLGFIFL